MANDTGGRPDHDVLVLGAGITGLVSASILVEQGNERVVVVDEYGQVGGNHLDVAIDGYTFDIGSLVFQDDSPLLDHFPELLAEYVPIAPSWGKLTPQGVITQYPFSVRDDVLTAGPVEWARLIGSAALARIRHRQIRNAKEFAEFWIGPRLLHRSGLENYMERFCGLPADRIDLAFAESRMLWISEQASAGHVLGRIRHSLRRQPPVPPTNRQLARPRAGFAQLYRPAVERLATSGVTFELGSSPTHLERIEHGYALQVGGRRITAGRVVSTIPIDHALALTGVPVEAPLPSVTLISLFYSFQGHRGFPDPILYNFSHDGAWKRLTTYSDFYGRHRGREYFTVEVISDHSHRTAAQAHADFRSHTAVNGLLDGDLRLEGSHVLENAYPVYTAGAGQRAERAIAALRAFGVESFGRQGGFQYQPTARVSAQTAEQALGGRPTAVLADGNDIADDDPLPLSPRH